MRRDGGGASRPTESLSWLGKNATVDPAATRVDNRLLRVALLTGGGDKPYALGLASTLISQGVAFDFIGSDEVDGPELHGNPMVRFFNLRGDMTSGAGALRKVSRVLAYYRRLLSYVASSKAPKVLHILWNNKIEYLDRTFVMLFYRLLGKRIALTVHNVNARQRDGKDSVINRMTLKIQYRLVDQLFVHTEQMKRALKSDFDVPESKINVIPFGINSTVPNTALTGLQAKELLGLLEDQKVVLFFGNIAPYKGLEYLVEAMTLLSRTSSDYRLVIAGRVKDCAAYWEAVQRQLPPLRPFLVERTQFVPDSETEVYFKAAGVLALPYTHIFQSGVLFLGYNFGLPVIASDVGSLREDIVQGETGHVCAPRAPLELAKAIESYFAGPLYQQLERGGRGKIQNFARERYSWDKVGKITCAVYQDLLAS